MNKNLVTAATRLDMRSRPPGNPLMHQTWEQLLFLHWPIPVDQIRPLIPGPLEIETFEGHAWISITPFKLTHLHPIPGPEIPLLNSFYELNVRTYVHHKGVPGVWFFSLDASKTIPVIAARLFYALPYNKADMSMSATHNTIDFRSHRDSNPPANFEATWRRGDDLRVPSGESLAFFLVERYALYSADENSIFRTRIYHTPWNLKDAELVELRSTMHSSLGLPEPTKSPLLHFSERQDVETWAPEKVG